MRKSARKSTGAILLASFISILLCGNMGFGFPANAKAQKAGQPQPVTVIPQPGSTVMVQAGTDLQTVLNQAQPGDTLVLQAGATYTAPAGGFTLPAKSNPESKWITITTSDLAGLPAEGTRVGPQNSASMPKIVSPNGGAAVATKTGAGAVNASYWKVVGVEFSVTPTALPDAKTAGAGANTGLVRLGDPYETSLSNVPHHFVIDRCYIHGNPRMNTIRGVNLNSGATDITNSYLSDFHGIQWESQAICGWNGPGPYDIVNNYIEGATENLMFGGSDPKISGLVPSDITIKRNYFFKPPSWKVSDPSYAGYHWTVKNILELKNARRVLIEGNVFENSWVDGQIGYGISIKSCNQDGTAPWSQTSDVSFVSNIVRNVAVGIMVAARNDAGTIQLTTKVLIKNNVFENVNSAWTGGSGTMVRIIGGNAPAGYTSSGPTFVTVDHNTGFVSSSNSGKMLEVDDVTTNFVFTNNLFDYNVYAVKGSGLGDGNQTLGVDFPGAAFNKNAIVGNPTAGTRFSNYPGNFFPATWADVQLTNYNNGLNGDYSLAAASPYKSAGTDGKDLGADKEALNAAMSNAPANQPPAVSVDASPVSGTAPLSVSFNEYASDPDGFITASNWDFGDGQGVAVASPLHVYESAGVYTATVTVTDNQGATATAKVAINVSAPPNLPPQVSVTPSVTGGAAPLAVNLTSNASDPDGQVVSYKWDFGDGLTSTEASPSHTYQSAGVFVAQLTVTDDGGATAKASATITVSSDSSPPAVTVITPNTRVTLKFKSTYLITWSVAGGNVTQQCIDLSLDGGRSWRAIASQLPGTATSYAWKVPNQPTGDAYVRVRALNSAGLWGQDVSDTSFVISR